jgi:hypothetical protein
MSASSAQLPHISSLGRKLVQTCGRSAQPKIRHLLSFVNCKQRTPAGFPADIPGIGEEIDGAIQQAAQPARHSIFNISDTITNGAESVDSAPFYISFTST